jgi:hypothetical protein
MDEAASSAYGQFSSPANRILCTSTSLQNGQSFTDSGYGSHGELIRDEPSSVIANWGDMDGKLKEDDGECAGTETHG